ncbi:hypothetical protein HGB47_20680 [Leptospira yasudae]|uniref:hypothetical protein n=1 Tax=Leptospira yasudae TaxID=2202201 RepID=UPI001C4EC63C|nr:hypothetical protein [Leptospira yasudae]MBW0436026.1 hypothetical protein [Leptospira yasudae]
MIQNEYSFAFPIVVNYTERKATHSSFSSTSVNPSETIFKSRISNSDITFKICEPEELGEDDEPERIFLCVGGIVENNYQGAFEKAFELCNLFVNYYLFDQFEYSFNEELLDTKFAILKSQGICLKGEKEDNIRRTYNREIDIDLNNFNESFSIVYHDNLLRIILESLYELCGPHSDRSKFYSAFMTLEIIEANSSVKSKSWLSEDEKANISKGIELLFKNLSGTKKEILISRSKGYILGKGSDKDSRGEKLFYSINRGLGEKLPMYFRVTEKEAIDIVKDIVLTRNTLFHNGTLSDVEFKRNFYNLIILIRSIGKGLIDLKFNPFLPFNTNDA